MQIKDEKNFSIDMKGTLIFRIYKKGKLVDQFSDENIVVIQSREFVRNLAFGDTDNLITKLKIGDMNKTLSSDCSNLEQPKASDTDLINTFFSKEYKSKIKITDENGYPAIKFSFVITENEANDNTNPDFNRKLWCEFGLADKNDNIWTRKVKPIIKDNETRIEIDYILSF